MTSKEGSKKVDSITEQMMKPILLLFTLLGTQVSSVKNSVVQGTVKDLNGAVIWHALVQITKPPQKQEPARSPAEPGKSNPTATAETDQHGKFSTDLPPGLYQVCVSGKGFMRTCRDAQADDGKAVTLDFSLGFDPAYMPAETEVMDQRLRTIAGNGAIDCGEVPVGGDPAKASSCAMKASRQHKAFYVRYHARGIDAQLIDGLASNSKSDTYAVIFDSLGVSANDQAQDATRPDGDHTIVMECPKPTKIRKAKNGKLTCFNPGQKFFWAIE